MGKYPSSKYESYMNIYGILSQPSIQILALPWVPWEAPQASWPCRERYDIWRHFSEKRKIYVNDCCKKRKEDSNVNFKKRKIYSVHRFLNFFIFQSFHLKWGYVYQPKTTHRGQNQHYCLLSSALRDKGRYSSVGFFGDVSLHVPTRDKDLAAYCTKQNSWNIFDVE